MRFSPKRCTHQKLEDTELLICEAQEDIHSTRNSLTAKSKCPKVHSEVSQRSCHHGTQKIHTKIAACTRYQSTASP